MKKKIIPILIIAIASTFILSACKKTGSDPLEWLKYAAVTENCISAEYVQTIEKGSLTLSETRAEFLKDGAQWHFEKSEKSLSSDPYSQSLYEETSSEGTAQALPVINVGRDCIESFTLSEENGINVYNVVVKKDKTGELTGLDDEQLSSVTDLVIKIGIKDGKASFAEITYSVSGDSVVQKISYGY